MLAKRVIPTMLVRGRTLVKGRQFAGDRTIGHVLQAARVHAMRGVDELLILDIGATPEGRGPDLDMVRELSEGCFIPITVGGGVKSVNDIDALLRAGADKVAICTAAEPAFIEQAASRFGSQAITVVIEHDRSAARVLTKIKAFEMQAAGAGELILQSRDRDGTLAGYDLGVINIASHPDLRVPVIASGGCGTYEHMLEAFKAGADACAAGAMFAFTDAVPRGAARYLAAHGIPVRL